MLPPPNKTEMPISSLVATTVPPKDTPTPPEPTATPETSFDSSSGLIAFYSERDGNAEIYTMNPNGSDQRRLTFNQFEDSSPVW
jgi:hypothetical protein